MNYKKLAELVVKRLKTTIPNPEMQKAVEGDVKEIFDNIELVGDVWNQGKEGFHGIPSAEEIVYGPSQAASGGGANKMVREYSKFATQQGIAEEFERMSREMDGFKKSVAKAFEGMGAQLKSQGQVLTTFLENIVKAEEEDKDGPEKKEEMEKARSYQKKARTSLLKAEDEDEEKEDRKEEVEKAKSSLKKAKEILLKAHEEAKDEKEEEEVEKSLSENKKLSKKASEIESTFTKAEEAEKRKKEEEEAEKLKKAEEDKAKKEAEDKAKLGKEENQDVNATSKALTEAEIENIAKKSIMEMFDHLMTQSKTGNSIPSFAKADISSVLQTKAGEIEKKSDEGELSSGEVTLAKSLLMKVDMAHKGQIDMSIVKSLIEKAPVAVKNIFSTAV